MNAARPAKLKINLKNKNQEECERLELSGIKGGLWPIPAELLSQELLSPSPGGSPAESLSPFLACEKEV